MTLSGSSVRCAAASRAVTTEAPHKRESRRGRIPKEPLALYEGGPVTLCSQPKSTPFWTISPPLMTTPASRRSAARRSRAPRPGRSGRPSAQAAPRLSEFRHATRTPFWGYRHPIGTPGLRVHTGFHAVAFRVGGGEGRKVAPDENRPQPGGGPKPLRRTAARSFSLATNNNASKKSRDAAKPVANSWGRNRLAASHLSP